MNDGNVAFQEQMMFTFTPDTCADLGGKKTTIISNLIMDTSIDEPFLPSFGTDDGCHGLSLQERMRKISKEWGLVHFNKEVRVQLRDLPFEIVGYMNPVEIPDMLDRRIPLNLRLCYRGDFSIGEGTSTEFTDRDIESCHLI